MKKRRFVLLLCAVMTFVIGGVFMGCNPHKNALYIPEESQGFVDYEIIGDRVRFRYSVCFYYKPTEYNANTMLNFGFDAQFKAKELAGWVEPLEDKKVGSDGYFYGLDKNGERLSADIYVGEKIHVICTFEGKYLGGTVNEKLSFPIRTLVSMLGRFV